ncbi:MAG: hypothetical protein LBL55_10700 [Propionibacteriaceae bacterium]|nr:hypothetical protein [Propionibacteriaceae bacterium]
MALVVAFALASLAACGAEPQPGPTETTGPTEPSDTAESFDSLSVLVDCVNALYPDGRYEGYYLTARHDLEIHLATIELLNSDPLGPEPAYDDYTESLGYRYEASAQPAPVVYAISLDQGDDHFGADFAHDTLAQIGADRGAWFLAADRQEYLASRLAIIAGLVEQGQQCLVL